MKKLLLAVAAVLVLNVPAFAGSSATHDFKTLAPQLFKAPHSSSDVKNLKDDMIIVYGGEDVSPRISNEMFNA